MSAATPTGAELRARRERLGLSVDDAAQRISDAGLNRTAQAVANLEASCCIARDWFATAPVYAAALTAEEQRRGGSQVEPEVWEPVGGRRVTEAAEEAVRRVFSSKRPLVMAFNDTRIRVDLGTTAVEICAEYHASLTRRAPAEPVPPEGVTVKVLDGGGCTYVSINRGCSDDLIATIWHGDALAISIEDEYATPEALRFVADLADYRAAQHAAGDRQRRLDAVRAADDAYQAADRAYLESCTESTRFWNVRQEALIALAAARKEAGLT